MKTVGGVLCAAIGLSALTGCHAPADCAGQSADQVSLVYLNLAAKDGEISPPPSKQDSVIPILRKSADAVADLESGGTPGTAAVAAARSVAAMRAVAQVLPQIERACSAGDHGAWTAAVKQLMHIGLLMGGALGMPAPNAESNVGVFLPPSSTVHWQITMWPRDGAKDGLSANETRRYSWGQKGSVDLALNSGTMPCQVAGAEFTLSPFTADGLGGRTAKVIDGSFRLALPDTAEVLLTVCKVTTTNIAHVNADGTGVLSVALMLSSNHELWKEYCQLFGMVRVNLAFVHRAGALDFQMAGPQAALSVVPTSLSVPIDGDVCASLSAKDDVVHPVEESGVSSLTVRQYFSKAPGMPWTNGQIEELRAYCAKRGASGR